MEEDVFKGGLISSLELRMDQLQGLIGRNAVAHSADLASLQARHDQVCRDAESIHFQLNASATSLTTLREHIDHEFEDIRSKTDQDTKVLQGVIGSNAEQHKAAAGKGALQHQPDGFLH